MDKLCTLKSVVPGTIVEVPEDQRSAVGELAVVLSPFYQSRTSENVSVDLMRVNGNKEFQFWPQAKIDSTTLKMVEDAKFKREATQAFLEQKIVLPDMAMSSGCDPEIFVVHEDGSIFPAWEFMPDEQLAQAIAKEWMSQSFTQNSYSHKGSEWNDPAGNYCAQRCAAYWDGAQAEFAPYAKACLETLHYGTREGLRTILAAARAKDPKATLTLRNVIELPEAVLKNADDKYIQFHCSQSNNIYGDDGERVPNARNYKYRCSGGHIHLGYKRRFTAPAIEQIVRSLDGILGVAGVSLAAGIDNPERRNTYGRAGEFRLPKHGLEYRVLSNFWLSHPAIAMLVFELARAAVRMGESGLYNLCWDASEDEIRNCINECDVEASRTILTRNVKVLTGMLNGIWVNMYQGNVPLMRKTALHTIMKGIAQVVPNPADIEGNWNLGGDWMFHCRTENARWVSFCKTIKMEA